MLLVFVPTASSVTSLGLPVRLGSGLVLVPRT